MNDSSRPTLLLLLGAALFLIGCDKQSDRASPSVANSAVEAWIRFAALCQNAALDIPDIQGGRWSDENVLQFLEPIDDAKKELIAIGQLESTRIEIGPFDEYSLQARIEGLTSASQRIADRYGFFVARELCDLGLRRQLSGTTFLPNKPVILHCSLPKRVTEQFIEDIKNSGIRSEEIRSSAE